MTSSLTGWIDHIFNHPVSEPEWYWSEDTEEWAGPRAEIPDLIAETFERSGELLAGFSDEQIDRGFWYLVGATRPEFAKTLVDETIPLASRRRALRSFVPLFQQLMATRCTQHLGHTAEGGASPLNSACYIWWDLLRFQLWWPNRPDILTEIITTLHDLINIPHDAIRESTLHGIGHLCHDYPEYQGHLSIIIKAFLVQTPDLRPELLIYAGRAKQGNVL